MTEKDIEKSIASAVKEATPDILDDLMAELDIKEDAPPSLGEIMMASEGAAASAGSENRRKARIRMRRMMASCAAALVLMIGGVAYFGNTGNEAFAVVGLDVNPSVEISINKDEKVVSAKAINDDGKDIIGDMDLQDTDINVACNAIVGSMLTKGYLTDTSNGLLVSVNAEDEAKGHELEKQISDNLNAYLGDSEVAAAILGQYVSENPDVEAFAEEHGISMGKAWLIHNLMNTGSTKMTEDSLLELSTQDLILLGQNRNVESDVSYGQADTSEYIGRDKALATALGKAGLTESQVYDVEVDFDCENGVIIYEVGFDTAEREYEYDINAKTGEVIVFSDEVNDDRDGDDDDDRDDRDDDDDRYDDDDRDDDNDRDDDHDDDDDD